MDIRNLSLWLCLSLALCGCASPAQESQSLGATPTPFSIVVGGERVTLIPGQNILPELYRAAQNPDFLANNDWVLVDGYWDVVPKGVTIALEAEAPRVVDPTPTLMPDVPERWAPVDDPFWGSPFDYPVGWHIETLETELGEGLRVMDAAPVEASTQWVSLLWLENPQLSSMRVWIAEHEPIWGGEVQADSEGTIHGIPVLRQLITTSPALGEKPQAVSLVWISVFDRLYLWTAWPGDQPETVNLLDRMVYSFRP